MATTEPTYQPISQDELSALAKGGGIFESVLFAPDLALDDFDFTEARFERCLFRVPAIRGADFSQAVFKDCRFEPTRFANCRFAGAQFQSGTLFDLQQKKGCTFAFCEMPALESTKCNFATNTFERCDLYNLRALECSFRGVQFRQSTFGKAISRRSVLTKAFFDRCNLSFADLSGLQLQNSEFLSCKFSEASFIGADLSNATLLACTLDRVEWERAKLSNADLRGSQLAGLNLAALSDYAGLSISENEQSALLEQLGVTVHPDT